jgi:hypothetical protein
VMEDPEGTLLTTRFVIAFSLLIVVILFFGSTTSVCALPPSPPNDTPPSVFLTANPREVYADGTSTSTINASVWDRTAWVWFGLPVDFSTDSGEIISSAFIVNGTATVTLTAGTEPVVATIRAEADLGGSLGIVTNTTTVNFTTTEFDTGAGTYPSIAGEHEGVIKPTHAIVVKKMYMYPCAGTGGHFKSATFYNVTTEEKIANATWSGYQGDYHNLTFSEQFTLAEGEDYKYEIVTGSYSRIIHKQNCTTLDGSFINCTSFADVNGDVYDGWLPAFRLV